MRLDNPITDRMRERVHLRRHRYDVRSAPPEALMAFLHYGMPVLAMKTLVARAEKWDSANSSGVIHIPHFTR